MKMGWFIFSFRILIAFMSIFNNPVMALETQQKIALVIGNANYTNLPKLKNATSDAMAVARVLSQKDFTVFLVQNTSLDDLKMAVEFTSKRARNADQIIIYYAGHGDIKSGDLHLVPTQIVTGNSSTISTTELLNGFDAPFAQKAFIFDTCLENTSNTETLSLPRNIQMETLIVYATSFGQPAYDGAGDHSVFTGAFLDHTALGSIDLQNTLQTVRKNVIRISQSHQTPLSISTLTQPFKMNNDDTQSATYASKNKLLQSFSSSGYANKPLLNTISQGILSSGF